jgi:hypothetical protein
MYTERLQWLQHIKWLNSETQCYPTNHNQYILLPFQLYHATHVPNQLSSSSSGITATISKRLGFDPITGNEHILCVVLLSSTAKILKKKKTNLKKTEHDYQRRHSQALIMCIFKSRGNKNAFYKQQVTHNDMSTHPQPLKFLIADNANFSLC